MIKNINIKNLRELQEEKALLKAEIEVCKMKLRTDFNAIEEHLKPAAIALKFAKKVFIPGESGIAEHLARVVAGSAGNMLFKNYSWPVKLLLNYITKNAAGNYMSEHGSGLIAKITSWFKGMKKETEDMVEENA